MSDECKNLIVVGVGGQGVVLVSRIIGEASIKSDLNVMMSEIHGMAQRGGKVVSNIRIGDAHSPMFGRGEADVILGLEPVESYRHLDMASKKTTIVTSLNPILPFTVTAGEEEYPNLDELMDNMEATCSKLVKVDAEASVQNAGLPFLVTNIFMLGALFGACKELPLTVDKLKESLRENAPKKYVDVNIKAFELGYKETSH
jgi:indolepyruvate ferredoxin oxidoreductase beta subunit